MWMSWILPVSYTHLDVYKRQVQHNGGLLAAVLVDVGQVELGRQAEVQLAGGQGVLCLSLIHI